MENAWISVIGTLGGALGGAFVGGMLRDITDRSQFLRARDWERDKVIQQKLEEIYMLTTSIRRALVADFVGSKDAAIGRGEYRGEAARNLLPELRRLDALILFYGPPELKSRSDSLRELYDPDTISRVKEGDTAAMVEMFRRLFNPAIREAVEVLKDETVRLARGRLAVDDAWKSKGGSWPGKWRLWWSESRCGKRKPT